MKYILLILLYFSFSFTKAQNLVPNGSFENTTNCPTYTIYTSTLPFANSWQNPETQGTPDLFSSCDTTIPPHETCPDFGTPCNAAGYQAPHSGNNYSGIFDYGLHIAGGNVREYIQTTLNAKLLQNKKYCVSFYASLAENSTYATSRLGVYISNTAISSSSDTTLAFLPQIEPVFNNFISDTVHWTEIKGVYTASGGENYITIGNFFTYSNTDTLYMRGRYPFDKDIYYYIDDVSLTEYNNAYAGQDTSICKGEIVNLGSNNANFGANYNWSILKGDSSSLKYDTLSYNTAQPKKTTTYVLQKKQCGIFSYDTLTIHLPTAIIAKASNDTTICIGDSALLHANNLCNWCAYNWQPVQSHNTQIIVNPLASTIYTLSVKDSCFTTYSNVTVIIDYCQSPIVVVPNIFTPNADGINDAWQPLIQNPLNMLNYQCTIYDRWGIKVFDSPTTLNNIAWDGHSTSGLECSAGAYYYVVSYTDGKTKENKNLKGFLELVR